LESDVLKLCINQCPGSRTQKLNTANKKPIIEHDSESVYPLPILTACFPKIHFNIILPLPHT
jgi:hypothetical protein